MRFIQALLGQEGYPKQVKHTASGLIVSDDAPFDPYRVKLGSVHNLVAFGTIDELGAYLRREHGVTLAAGWEEHREYERRPLGENPGDSLSRRVLRGDGLYKASKRRRNKVSAPRSDSADRAE